MWYILGSIAVPVLLVPIFAGLFNYKLKFSWLQFIAPLIITLIWFYNGFNNVDNWGYPRYLFNLDPMYPGVFLSILLAIILKDKN